MGCTMEMIFNEMNGDADYADDIDDDLQMLTTMSQRNLKNGVSSSLSILLNNPMLHSSCMQSHKQHDE